VLDETATRCLTFEPSRLELTLRTRDQTLSQAGLEQLRLDHYGHFLSFSTPLMTTLGLRWGSDSAAPSPVWVWKDRGRAKVYGGYHGEWTQPRSRCDGPGRSGRHPSRSTGCTGYTAAGRHARESDASLEERGDQELGIASCQFRAGPVDCWSLRVSPAPETRRAADTTRSQRPANAVRRQLSMSGVVPASPAGRPRASVETTIAYEVKIQRFFQSRTKKIQY
jgi:hypothetical protein